MEHSIFKLPASYGVEVDDDIVSFDLADRGRPVDGNNANNKLSSKGGAGVLLVAKTCDALAKAGYGDEDIRTVGGLVSRNLMTCESSQIQDSEDVRLHAADGGADRNDTGTENTQNEVELMLRGLLDENNSRSRSVRMNSNEPVVLINFSAQIGQKMLRDTTDDTVKQLQEDWNIWPVRVYAGPFLPTSDGFSITLLNVVNTDIGGPSMVQLLDEASSAHEWCQYMRKEAWRGRDLLYREERDGVPASDEFPDDASEQSVESDDNDSVESEPSATILQAPSLQEDAVENDEAIATSTATMDLASRDLSSEAQKDPSVDEPEAEPEIEAEAEGIPLARELELPERHVEHPTWDRQDDSTSLMDLIRSQASMLAPFGQEKSDPAAKEFPKEEADDAEEELNPAEKSSSDGGDYVVV